MTVPCVRDIESQAKATFAFTQSMEAFGIASVIFAGTRGHKRVNLLVFATPIANDLFFAG